MFQAKQTEIENEQDLFPSALAQVQVKERSSEWLQLISAWNLVNTSTGASPGWPSAAAKREEQTPRRCATADYTHGQLDQVIWISLWPFFPWINWYTANGNEGLKSEVTKINTLPRISSIELQPSTRRKSRCFGAILVGFICNPSIFSYNSPPMAIYTYLNAK